ncbi:MAG: cation diffusion facilitator family transporter [Mesorhizobium sp.]
MAHSHEHDHGSHAGHSHDVGNADKNRVLIAAVLTGGFMVAEAIGGLLTGSLALLADAGHMLTDGVALAFAWYAFHLAGRAATSRMTYGFHRVKTLVAFVNGLAVLAIGLWITYEAWERFNTPAPVLGGPMLVIAMLGLGVNIAAFYALHGGDRDSLNMRGAILHVLGDMLGSVAAMVAAVVIIFTGWTPIDPILSVVVSLLLFRSAWFLVHESGTLLLEGSPAALDRDKIAADLVAHVKNVREVHHVHIWSLDGARNVATLHACLERGAEPFGAIKAIKSRLATAHGITHATVEPEIEECADYGKAHGCDDDHHDHDHDHAHAGHTHGGSRHLH